MILRDKSVVRRLCYFANYILRNATFNKPILVEEYSPCERGLTSVHRSNRGWLLTKSRAAPRSPTRLNENYFCFKNDLTIFLSTITKKLRGY